MRLCSMLIRILAFCMISSVILPTAIFGRSADGNAFLTMETQFSNRLSPVSSFFLP